MNRWRDKNDVLNSPEYHTGKKCMTLGCRSPAGTAWSPFWCQFHNAERMDHLDKSLKEIQEQMGCDKNGEEFK